MIVYGKNVWKTLMETPHQIGEVYLLKGRKDDRLMAQLASLSIKPKWVDRAKLDEMTQTKSHQGIACQMKPIETVDLETLFDQEILVTLDGIQDPHNVGAILRTCDAAGVGGLILPKRRSALLTPAAIKTSTGAAYHVPVSVVNNLNQALVKAKKAGYWIVGTGFGQLDYRQMPADRKIVLVIGSEGKGISELVQKHCDYLVSIPMLGHVQSLNASVATGILLYQYQALKQSV